MKSISIYKNTNLGPVLLRVIQVHVKFQPDREWRLYLEPKSTHMF